MHTDRDAAILRGYPFTARQPALATILVTDGEQRSTLAAVRSLGRAGHRVLVSSASGRSLAAASRFSADEVRVPDVLEDTGAFARAIHRVVAETGCDLVIPMTDPSAVALLEAAETVGPEARASLPRLAIPDLDAYALASDKARLMSLAEEEAVPVPDQVVVGRGEADTAIRFAEDTGWPVILKPARSAVATEGRLMRTGVRLVETPEELADGLADIPEAAFPVLVQRRVEGPGLGAFVLAVEGEVVASFAHRRLREKPPTGGVSVYRESVPVRDDLRTHAARLMRRLRWTGVAMIEFKEESATGTPYLMEINARFWGSLQLAIDAGVDFPRLLTEVLLEGRRPPTPEFRAGVRSRWFWGDADHLLWILRAPSRYRTLHPRLPSRLGAVGRFLLPWRPGNRWEVFRLTDPRPFLRESTTWFADLLR